MSLNQSTISASSESSAERSWAGRRAGRRPAHCPRVRRRRPGLGRGLTPQPGCLGAGDGKGVLTPLGRPQALLQVHAPELQDVQLPLDTLHLPLDLLLGHVVGVQLGVNGGGKWQSGAWPRPQAELLAPPTLATPLPELFAPPTLATPHLGYSPPPKPGLLTLTGEVIALPGGAGTPAGPKGLPGEGAGQVSWTGH